MVMDNLGKSLRTTLRKIVNASNIDEGFIKEISREIQRALISADVDIKLVFSLTNAIKERALSEKPKPGLTQREHAINIVYEEMSSFLGKKPEIHLEKRPLKIMLLGLFGNGKTTTVGKLAWFFKKRGVKVGCIGTDTWRPAAYEQLKQIGESIQVPVYGSPTEKNPVKTLQQGLIEFASFDVIIVDTAGRDALDGELINEAMALNQVLSPDEVFLVLSGDIGQQAKTQAQAFHDAVGVTGVIVTKLDGTAKGGGALSACAVTSAPVKFLGVGEKSQDIELFDPAKFVSRLLGMGDIESLLAKVQEVVEESDLDPNALLKGTYSLRDFYDQLEATQKMGPLKQVMSMLGVGVDLPDDMLKMSEDKMKEYKYILDSMTVAELEEPKILNKKRIDRIAKGSGTSKESVRELIQNFNQSKKMLKMFKKKRFKGDMAKMMKSMQGMGGGKMPFM